MIKNILIPIENSDTITASGQLSSNVHYGTQLARQFGAKITFLQAHPVYHGAYPTGNFPGAGVVVNPMAESFDKEEARKNIGKMLKREFPDMRESDYDIVVLPGATVEVIKEHAKDLDVDLIVVSSEHEASGLDALVGMIAERVSRKAFCTTLIVPREYDYKPLQKIGLAINEENVKEEIPVEDLLQFVRSYSAALEAIHVMEGTPEDISQATDEIYETLMQRLSNDDKLDFDLRTVADSDVKNEVESFINSQGVDLLALIHRDHGFLKRLFAPGLRKQLISEATIPLLILK